MSVMYVCVNNDNRLNIRQASKERCQLSALRKSPWNQGIINNLNAGVKPLSSVII